MWTLWRAAQEKKNHRFRFNRTLQLQNRREGLYSLHTVCVVRGWYTVVAGSLTLVSGSASLLAPLRCESLCFILEVTCFALFKAPLLLLSVDLKKTEKKRQKICFQTHLWFSRIVHWNVSPALIILSELQQLRIAFSHLFSFWAALSSLRRTNLPFLLHLAQFGCWFVGGGTC